MEKKVTIIGNNFTSLILAFMLSKEEPNLKICYYYEENLLQNCLFLPGCIYPLFNFPATLIQELFKQGTEFFNEIYYTTKFIDLSMSNLLIVNNTQKETKVMHDKLKKLSFTCSILKKEDIEQTIPLFGTKEYSSALLVEQSMVVNNLSALSAYFFDELRTPNVELTQYKRDQLVYNQKTNNFMFKDNDIPPSEQIILTDPNLIQEKKEMINVFAIKTSLVEKFPRLSIIDNRTNMFIYLENEGYLSVLQLFNKPTEKMIKHVEANFKKIFPFIEGFNVLDNFQVLSVKKPIIEHKGKLVKIYLPYHQELNVIPFLFIKVIPSILKKEKIDTLEF